MIDKKNRTKEKLSPEHFRDEAFNTTKLMVNSFNFCLNEFCYEIDTKIN